MQDIFFDEAVGVAALAPTVASDVMRRFLVVAHPAEPLRSAIIKLLDGRVRHLPVVDETARVVGILSDRDVRTAVGDPTSALARGGPIGPIAGQTVGAIMTKDPICARAGASLADVAQLFVDERIGAVPVVLDDDTLVGIISYVDVIAHLLRGAR